jgi:hypothetical protein
MRTSTRNAVGAAAVALAVAGCNGGTSSCPTEPPRVEALSAGCTERANETVSYPLRLCPTCNQIGAACEPDLSAVGAGTGDIFLNVTVETCESSTSCGPSCDPNPFACTFIAPQTPGVYTVTIFDGTGGTLSGALEVISAGPESCATL